MSEPQVAIDPSTLTAFRARLRGSLLLPDADRDAFAESCRIWNGMIKTRPVLVVQATGTADIVECVRFAREHGLPIAAKAGGHNIAGTSLAPGGLTVDLCRMRGVLVDRSAKVARVQGGCLLGDVDRETQLHGLATVLGFVSETGVAGLTLGGGFGYLTRRFGWAADNLLEAEVVTADARVVRASASENRELFWALRGGGANFGVVTSFAFRLHELGPTVTAGMIVWPAAQATEVLERYAELTASSSRELTLAATMRLAPPAPFLPKDWHGKPIIGVVVCHTGTPAQASADLAALRSVGTPIADLVTQKPYTAQQAMLDATQPKGLHYYWRSEYLSTLTESAQAAYRRFGACVPTPQSQIILFQVGPGALAERPADDGSVGNRDAHYVFGAAGSWPEGDPNAAAHQRWVHDAWGAMQPHSTGGVYVNFLTAEEGEDRVRAAYGANFARLRAVKREYDPDNLFRSNKNVPPESP